MLAVDARKSERFVQVCFVTNHVGGDVGTEDLFFGHAGFRRWADTVPLHQELIDRVTAAFVDMPCRPVLAGRSIHPSAGRISGTSDKMCQ